MKQLFIYSILLISLLASCDKSDHVAPPLDNRTVIIYMVGDNSLTEITQANLQELVAGTTAEKLNNGNLVVYVDNRKQRPQILQIKIEEGKAVEKLVKTYEEQDSANPTVMKGVIADIAKEFATPHYGLVLWSHASAWIPKGANDMLSTRSFGSDNGSEMDIDVLREVLSEGNIHYDFILFDACYMGSVEVAYELRKHTDYLLASPMEVIAKGFPYEQIVEKFFSMPANVQGICEDFFNYYNKQEGDLRTASVALVDAKRLDALAATVRNIMQIHKADLTSVDLTKVQALEYYHSKRLLYDFDDYIKNLVSEGEYATFQKALRAVVLYEAHTPTSYFAYPAVSYSIPSCCGLNFYPLGFNPQLDEWYSRLEWYKAVYK